MNRKTKLELTWIGKETRPKLEPRILLEDPEKSYHAAHRQNENDLFDNRLIFGDNLLALKALEQEFSGKIKCVYIDPPYNTGSAFPSYDDGLEHSLWLTMIRDRLEIIWRLLSDSNGTLLISINDQEAHYLKVLCDEVFGRKSFITTLVWNYEGNTDNTAQIINYHEYILVYSKSGIIDEPGVIDPSIEKSSKLFKDEIRNTIVKNGPKNPEKSVKIHAGFPASFDNGKIIADKVRYPKYSNDIQIEEYRTTNDVIASTGWSSRELLEEFIAKEYSSVTDSKGQLTKFEITRTGAIEAIKQRVQNKGHFISVLRGFGTTNQMRLLLEKLRIKFTYPKPVDLIAYLIEAFTGPNDWVLDSFAGSGTTGHAVMKLNLETGSKRRFILVELREETVTSVLIPRLRAVIDGDKNAKLPPHNSGFRYFRLAPSLLEKDKWGNWVISKEFDAAKLAEAVCKLEGFTYAPSDTVYWQHGHSTERDFIYVTTQTLTHDQLHYLNEEVGTDQSLLILCAAFHGDVSQFQNLTVKKIPKQVLSRCEWGKDDYSLNIKDLPYAEPELGQINLFGEEMSND